eukprot:gene43923-53701_t
MQAIKVREQDNPSFSFLFADSGSGSGSGSAELAAASTYYRWKTYVCALGEGQAWRGEPFQLWPHGVFYAPPPPPRAQDGDADALSDEEAAERPAAKRRRAAGASAGSALAPEDEAAFLQLLRQLSLSRASVRACMGFCFDLVAHGAQLVRLVCERLVCSASQRTAGPARIAGLYLLSDLLHNSAAPLRGASQFRREIEAQLLAHKAIREAAVLAQDGNGGPQLV